MGSHEERGGATGPGKRAGPEATRWGSQLQGDKIPPSQGLGVGEWGGLGSASQPHLYWGGERRGGLLLPLLGSGSTGAPASSWPRGRRLLAEPGFSMPGLLRRGKLLSARAAWRAQSGGPSAGSTWVGDVPSPALGSLLWRVSAPWQISSAPASDPDLPPSFAENLGVTYSFQGDRGPPPPSPRPTHTRTSQGRGRHYLSVPTSLPRAPCLCRRQWRRLSSEASERVGR